MSTALMTDHYELTMLRAALRSGAANRRVVFEVFTRSLPPGRRFGVFAGTGRLLDALADFRFSPPELAALRAADAVDDATAAWLADYRFRGDIRAFAEGEPFFPDTPVLAVEGTFAESVLLETLVLSILNHDSAIAAAAARMVAAAGERPCLEMGSRRTHEAAAVAAARAAYLAGFAASSNLEAARTYAVPSVGTSAHAFTLVHPSEAEAFAAQVAALGRGTTLLVDTYDVPEGIAAAVAAAGPELGAIRIDSGDLGRLATAARAQLDALGATGTRIIATGDLDEHAIARLGQAPVDGYGVGTSLVTGSGAPTAGFVYKLVEVDGVAVAKRSVGKTSRGGRKRVVRRHDPTGRAVADVVLPSTTAPTTTAPSTTAPTTIVPTAAPTAGTTSAATTFATVAERAVPERAVPAATGAAQPVPAAGATALPAGFPSLSAPVLPPTGAPLPADAGSGSRPGESRDRELLRSIVVGGELVDAGLVGPAGTRRAREHHGRAFAALPPTARDVRFGQPCLPVVHTTGA
ncbi:nicotinate phosphoribosyltransferase [Frankia sp. QA3]|uniref:nicotinate phosphoribosyltransferase n=1 Tax=Frankia sp. QA3 TaxID=710111 RepID=UPI0006889E91|nr:nicotinate phosphoribosyltransferase [Frankia sp. QA3]